MVWVLIFILSYGTPQNTELVTRTEVIGYASYEECLNGYKIVQQTQDLDPNSTVTQWGCSLQDADEVASRFDSVDRTVGH